MPEFNLENFNSYIKNIEPNLNKILFSQKVILVEGPNDLMVYNYIIQKKVQKLFQEKNPRKTPLDCEKYARTYLNFNNFVIIPHHGKATAYLLSQLCKHLKIEYFLINDWDLILKEESVKSLSETNIISDTDENEIWQKFLAEKQRLEKYKEKTFEEIASIFIPNLKGILTSNKNLEKESSGKIHFNNPKLEKVIDYEFNDKNSEKIWKKINQMTIFDENIFPPSLEEFLEFAKITSIE
jgi:hypothetical protein